MNTVFPVQEIHKRLKNLWKTVIFKIINWKLWFPSISAFKLKQMSWEKTPLYNVIEEVHQVCYKVTFRSYIGKTKRKTYVFSLTVSLIHNRLSQRCVDVLFIMIPNLLAVFSISECFINPGTTKTIIKMQCGVRTRPKCHDLYFYT